MPSLSIGDQAIEMITDITKYLGLQEMGQTNR